MIYRPGNFLDINLPLFKDFLARIDDEYLGDALCGRVSVFSGVRHNAALAVGPHLCDQALEREVIAEHYGAAGEIACHPAGDNAYAIFLFEHDWLGGV